ncbi:hypothetical protein THAOC_23389 [Thalassiosira oceanica]|uniref:Uncharacterized protein n=1 Tax=Thalassiosira oceanica TaxID=159749 RepID=K0S740_THAOC|nr:hypothetical protein THAOC_23389 [Thalassiosira oceanica]|eukprot:EJK56681.1 hypothetical protein THAOC_23389 [Thalassiosira oceanica]
MTGTGRVGRRAISGQSPRPGGPRLAKKRQWRGPRSYPSSCSAHAPTSRRRGLSSANTRGGDSTPSAAAPRPSQAVPLASNALSLNEFNAIRATEAPQDFGGVDSETADGLWGSAIEFEYEPDMSGDERGAQMTFALESVRSISQSDWRTSDYLFHNTDSVSCGILMASAETVSAVYEWNGDDMEGIEVNPLLGSMKMVAQTVNVIRARMAGTDLGAVSVSAASGRGGRAGGDRAGEPARASPRAVSRHGGFGRGDRRGPQGEDLGRRRRRRQVVLLEPGGRGRPDHGTDGFLDVLCRRRRGHDGGRRVELLRRHPPGRGGDVVPSLAWGRRRGRLLEALPVRPRARDRRGELHPGPVQRLHVVRRVRAEPRPARLLGRAGGARDDRLRRRVAGPAGSGLRGRPDEPPNGPRVEPGR